MTLLFDALSRLLINSGSPGQAGPFDKDGRLLVNDSHKSTSTRNVAGDDAYEWATEGNDEVKVPRSKLPAATTTAAGAVRAATADESEQDAGAINLAWSITKLRALFATALPDWVKTAATLAPNSKIASNDGEATQVLKRTAEGREWQSDGRITTLATITRIAALPIHDFMSIALDRAPTAGTVVMLTIVSPTNRIHPFSFPADDFLTEMDDTAGDPPTAVVDTDNMIQLKTTRNDPETDEFSHSIWFVAKASDTVMWIGSHHSNSWGIFKAIVREQR